MDKDNIEKIIRGYELKLLDKNIRNKKNELAKLISKDFLEYGSSGKIYTFNDTIDLLTKDDSDLQYRIIKMDTKIISEDVIIIVYTIEMENKGISERISIWKNENNEWKIIFHKGNSQPSS